MDELFLSLHHAALSAKDGISGLARRKGWRVQTTINKLNPLDHHAEPKLGEFVAILTDSKDLAPLEVLCAMFGGRFVTRTQEARASVLEAVLHASAEHGDIATEIERALADDNQIDAAELRKILYEIAQARQALAVLENTVREKCEPSDSVRAK